MRITLNRGGELWWMTQRPDGPRVCLRYGIRRSAWSYLATFGFVSKLDARECVPCTDDGDALLYKARWGPLYADVSYMRTEAEARDLVLHMAHDHTGYLRQPANGSRDYNRLPFETYRYTWELAKC